MGEGASDHEKGREGAGRSGKGDALLEREERNHVHTLYTPFILDHIRYY